MKVTLGKTGITVDKNGFGALPVQRVEKPAAVALIRRAYERGIRFFDTARSYTDSEEKLGEALAGFPRGSYYIATKTPAGNAADFWKDLEVSLEKLQTDYIDIYQFHNPAFCPKPEDGTGLYEAMREARRQGKIRFIGITNHRIAVAEEAIESGLYDTLQFPFSYLSSDKDLEVEERCKAAGMGFIAMKALSGGLIANGRTAYAFMTRFPNVLPIWGIQREEELDEFLECAENPPALTAKMLEAVEKDKAALAGEFCRGCGYCQPCPAGIEIFMCARMSLLLRRAVTKQYFEPYWQEKMAKIEECLHCGRCRSRCPYGLDTPALLERNYQDYQEVLRGKPL